jgi:iron(III) transport system substrate-binding protein
LLPTVCLFSRSQLLSERQDFLLRPFLDVFEEKGNQSNVCYLKKGSLERLKQQPGSVDAILTVDIANLTAIAAAGLFQPIQSRIMRIMCRLTT